MDTHMYWIFLWVFTKTMVGWSVRWFPSHVWWHRRVYDMYMICIWYVYDMYMICMKHMICIWYVYGYWYHMYISYQSYLYETPLSLVGMIPSSIKAVQRTFVTLRFRRKRSSFIHGLRPWSPKSSKSAKTKRCEKKRGQKRAFVGHFNRFPFGPWKDPSLYPLVI